MPATYVPDPDPPVSSRRSTFFPAGMSYACADACHSYIGRLCAALLVKAASAATYRRSCAGFTRAAAAAFPKRLHRSRRFSLEGWPLLPSAAWRHLTRQHDQAWPACRRRAKPSGRSRCRSGCRRLQSQALMLPAGTKRTGGGLRTRKIGQGAGKG